MIQLGELGPDSVIWRYMPFERFELLIELGAVWFSKLKTFNDAEEGVTLERTRIELKNQHHLMEQWFQDEERKRQVRRFVEDNEDSGRELIVASCWFIDDNESKKMWAEYAKNEEGVVIKSTVGSLARSLVQSHKKWWIGKVSYIDLSIHDGMNAYDGSQAHLRAFLKGMNYSHERELRVATMNYVAPGCLNPDGSPQNEKQRAGLVYSPDRPGIYVTANLSVLIKEVRTAPHVTDCHRKKIELLMSKAGCRVPVGESELLI